jgi:DNA polymerase-3 subunit alpha
VSTTSPSVPGRGSAAGSLVAFCLGITNIDPLRFELVFERFLNPERVSPPDIDIDFCQTRRPEVIQYVREKYGDLSVCHIITFGTMGAKSVIRDVGRVLGWSYGDSDALSKMIPNELNIDLEESVKKNPDLAAKLESDTNAQELWRHATFLEGLTRGVGVHAAGVVIGDRRLDNFIALTRDKEDAILSQYAMKPLTELGMLKMDFLGLKTLTVIHEAEYWINKRVPASRWPTCRWTTSKPSNSSSAAKRSPSSRWNPAAWSTPASSSGRTPSRKSSLFWRCIVPARCSSFRTTSNAKRARSRSSIRIRCSKRSPRRPTASWFIRSRSCRPRTCSPASRSDRPTCSAAPWARRTPPKWPASASSFVEGCLKTNDIQQKQANAVFDLLEKFAQYGFNKSHSAAYGIVTYRTAYLKANYPVEFMAGVLSYEISNPDKIANFVSECFEMGIKVLPPDINKSALKFAPERFETEGRSAECDSLRPQCYQKRRRRCHGGRHRRT